MFRKFSWQRVDIEDSILNFLIMSGKISFILIILGCFILVWGQTGATGTFNAGNWDRPLACQSSIDINVAAASTTELIALVAGDRVRICGFVLSGTGAATGSIQFLAGTGAACDTGASDLSGIMSLIKDTPMSYGGGLGKVFSTPVAEALCIKTVGASFAVDGILSYGQF